MDKSIYDLIKSIQGYPARKVKLGHGSFITINFGENRIIEVSTKKGLIRRTRGEWYLWIYMCAWRLDKDEKPYLGSNDEFNREEFQERLSEVEGKKLLRFDILNSAFDTQIEFEGNLVINLFSFSTKSEQWKLFRPDKNVLTVGPGKTWTYKSENESG